MISFLFLLTAALQTVNGIKYIHIGINKSADSIHMKDIQRTKDVTLWGTLKERMEILRTFTITCSTLLVTSMTSLQPETDLHAIQKPKLRLI